MKEPPHAVLERHPPSHTTTDPIANTTIFIDVSIYPRYWTSSYIQNTTHRRQACTEFMENNLRILVCFSSKRWVFSVSVRKRRNSARNSHKVRPTQKTTLPCVGG